MFCFFFKLFNKCFVFLYFLARGGLGIPDAVRQYLSNPAPVPRQPRQLPPPSQRRSTGRPPRVYYKISEFTWLNQHDIEYVRAWIGHDTDPGLRDWRYLCFDPTCIDKARKILQPGDTDPKLALGVQLPSHVRAVIVGKHCVPEGFNFNDPSFCQQSSTNRNSVFNFTSDCLDGFLHTMYSTALSPSNSTIVYNHEYDPTCQQLADLSSLYEVEMLYKSPAAQIGGIGGKSMLK